MKRIEDKKRREEAFTKLRVELNKEARELSNLCNANAAVVVISSDGELYEYYSGGTNRFDEELNKFSLAEMTELEQELHDALMLIRSRKVRKLAEENEELKRQVATAAKLQDDDDEVLN